MSSSFGCSSGSCVDVRNPIRLSSGCSTERYLMRQRYLRSYPLMTTTKKENVAKRTKNWLKKQHSKYYCRLDDDGDDDQRNKSKPNPPRCSYLEACLKLLLVVCEAKVEVGMENRNPKPVGFGIKKL
ncbi:hypothetical protein PTKIN_Ptkin08bG0176200 [Pterospermum kingtungense]